MTGRSTTTTAKKKKEEPPQIVCGGESRSTQEGGRRPSVSVLTGGGGPVRRSEKECSILGIARRRERGVYAFALEGGEDSVVRKEGFIFLSSKSLPYSRVHHP